MSLDLYLYYALSIEPLDEHAAKIKKLINLSELVKENKVIKNNDVYEHFRNIKMFCPVPTEAYIDIYYSNYNVENHTIKILFYKVNNCELLTSEVVLTNKNILTSIHRTINIQNNLLSEFDTYYTSELVNIMKVMTEPRYYSLTDINVINGLENYPLNNILKTKLYDYQKDNVNWMLNLESNPIKDYINCNKMLYFSDGRIYDYTENIFINNNDRELITLKGGMILDTVGIGKTVQLLCLAVSNMNIKTLILVPDHLEQHWKTEFKKHFNIKIPKCIIILPFKKLINHNVLKYDRLIIDEIHELYTNENYKQMFDICCKTNCKYKWGMTATPFCSQNSIYNILKFLTEKELFYKNIERFSYFYETYYKIFRRNTLENIVNEVKLPNISNSNMLLEFNSNERILYDAETMAHKNSDITSLRKYCCDIMINFSNEFNTISLTEYNNIVINEYKYKYDIENEKLNEYIAYYDNCLLALNETNNVNNNIFKMKNKDELQHNIMHYKSKIEEQQIIVNNRKIAYDYLHSKITEENKICPICLDEICDDTVYDITECGHIYCTECLKHWLAIYNTCAVCKRSINKTKIYTISNLEEIELKYSTKIDKVLNIISTSDNANSKFVIYTQFSELSSKLSFILNKEGIKCIEFDDVNKIEQFRNDNEVCVLILNSVVNASGIDLSFVSNIIIFEPIIGNTIYLKDVEKQIIGRIYRINQTNDINVHRLIIKDTIEEEIYKSALQ